MDFSAVCRTCIKTFNFGLNPIFLNEDTHDRFSSAFYSCTGVQAKFNDGLPQNMCTACMVQFNNTLKFRKQCKQAEMQLLKIITEVESQKSSVNTDEEYIKITNQLQINQKHLTMIEKSDLEDLKRIKSEHNDEDIKREPPDIHIAKHKILCNDMKEYSNQDEEENSDTEYLNEVTEYENESHLKIETAFIYNADDSEIDFKRSNKNKQVLTKTTRSDDEQKEPAALDSSNSNSGDERNIDIPYIVSDTDTKKTTRVVCKLCQKELSIRSIDSHMMRRHPGADKRKIKCELCDKYLMREKMNRHRVMMHGSVGVKCGYCKSEFKSQEALVEHVATCTAKSKKRKVNDSGRVLAECDICKMTMQRASLIKHKAVKHAGLRPVCEHCGKCFGNKFRLNEHYRAKHGYEKFQCSFSYCDFRSASIMAMRNHERRHRGEKPFICETCGAKFHAAYILIQHKHSHRTEKLVKCDLCPASFKANNNLHMHKLTCHSKSLYSCTLCARTYKCRHYAVKHARLAHRDSDANDLIKLMPQ